MLWLENVDKLTCRRNTWSKADVLITCMYSIFLPMACNAYLHVHIRRCYGLAHNLVKVLKLTCMTFWWHACRCLFMACNAYMHVHMVAPDWVAHDWYTLMADVLIRTQCLHAFRRCYGLRQTYMYTNTSIDVTFCWHVCTYLWMMFTHGWLAMLTCMYTCYCWAQFGKGRQTHM